MATPTGTSCFGGNNGSIGLSVAGGTGPYFYTWNNGATIPNISNLVAGSYSVTVTDAKGCSITASAAVAQPASVLSVATTVANASCFGSTNGTINLIATGGTPVYSYNWGGGVTSQNRANLSAGSYNVTVTDSKGCSVSTSAVITQPAAPLSALVSATNINCFAGNTGAINLSVVGGTTPYAFNWGGGVVTQNRSNLTSGTYNVTVTDANGCSATSAAIITQPVAALSATATPTGASCYGGNNGSIGLSVAGGTVPYAYLWNNGAITANISNLVAANYIVTVTDANGCSITTSTAISQPASALAVSASATNVGCFGANTGAINLGVTGGTGPYNYNWNDGATTQNRIGLSAGSYDVTVTDAKGCSAITPAIITQPVAAISATTATTNALCFGGNTGAINLTVAGGTTPYAFNWGGGVVAQNRNNMAAGNYNVTITDANGCSLSASANVGQPLAALLASAQSNSINCFGGNSGSVSLQITGGTAPYAYNWTGGITTAQLTNISAGSYSVTITDAHGCSASIVTSVLQPASAVNVATAVVNVGCYGDTSGIITVATTGGTSPYNYSWSDGSVLSNRNALTAGSYVLTVVDANGCTATISATVSQPQPLHALAAVHNVSCNPGADGSISVTATGGTQPYSYKWDGGITTRNRTQLAAGNYPVTVTDANGCNVVNLNAVTQPAAIVVSLNPTMVSCYNGNNGAISLTATGGTSPYAFNWGGSVTSQNRAQLAAGNYTVTLTDANACMAIASAAITQPGSGLTASTTVRDVNCYGGNNGSIQVLVNGGTAPYAFNWTGGDTAQSLSGLTAGTYHVTVSDGNGCGTAASGVITQPNSGLVISTSPTNVNCNGGNNGAVNVTVTGGTSPYYFGWTSGQTTQNISNLVAGIYSVAVSDANACNAASSASVTQPAAALNASLAVTNVKCFGGNNGALNLTVTGGTSPYSYTWSNSATTQDLQSLTGGTYRVTITDYQACTAVVSAPVAQPSAAVTASLTDSNVSCFAGDNGSINLTVAGGTSPYTYNWGGGITSQNRTGLSAGTYVVTVHDANACIAIASSIISQPASAIAISAVTDKVSCFNGNNGSIHLTVTGGTAPYSYNWAGGINTQNRTNLVDGNYVVTVTDNKGCSATSLANISQPQSALGASIAGQTNVNCFNANTGAIQMSVAGGTAPYHYHWTDGATTENRNNLAAGSYHVTITDNNGCSAIDSVRITQPRAALGATAQATNISCFGGNNGAIALTVTGGTPAYSYYWAGGVTTQNRTTLLSGNYSVTVTDQHGCEATASAYVSQPVSGISITKAVTPATCYNSANGTILVNAQGGVSPYSFVWAGGIASQGRSGLAAGSYTITVSDANGCSTTSTIVLTAPDSITLTHTQTNPLCYGAQNGKIEVNATGGTPAYHYVWNTGAVTPQITNAAGGNYTVTVTDANGCTGGLTGLVLTQPAQIYVAVSAISGSCASNATGQLNAVVTGGSSPYHYAWSDNKATANISGLPAGNYAVTVTDANQCTQTANAVVNTYPGVSGNGFTHPLACQNAKGEITMQVTSGNAPYTFKWSDGDTTQDLYNVHPGTYTVTVHDANGCSFDTTFTIENLNSFNVHASGGGTIVLGGSVELNATGDGSNQTVYSWSPGASLSCIICPNSMAQPVETTIYTVVGTDTNGCVASDTVSVQVIEDHTIWVPNAFTPNGDGNNDVFKVYGNKAGIHSIEVKIFDRWGEKVFESENPDFEWDGTYKGVIQNINVFVYEMKVVFNDGHVNVLRKGSVTLIR